MDTLSPHPPPCIGYRDYTEEIITYAHFSFLYGSEVRTQCYSLLLSCAFFCHLDKGHRISRKLERRE